MPTDRSKIDKKKAKKLGLSGAALFTIGIVLVLPVVHAISNPESTYGNFTVELLWLIYGALAISSILVGLMLLWIAVVVSFMQLPKDK